MKKLLLLVLFLTTNLFVNAQVSWSVRGSIFTNNTSCLGSRYGLSLECPITSHFSIQPALYLHFKFFEETNSYTKTVTDDSGKSVKSHVDRVHDCKETYLDLPINALFRIPLRKNNSILLAVGPYFGYALGGKTKYTRTVDGVSTVKKYGTFDKDGMGLQRFDYGLNYEAHLELGHFVFGPYMEIGIASLDDNELSNPVIYLFTRHNFACGFELGYKF